MTSPKAATSNESPCIYTLTPTKCTDFSSTYTNLKKNTFFAEKKVPECKLEDMVFPEVERNTKCPFDTQALHAKNIAKRCINLLSTKDTAVKTPLNLSEINDKNYQNYPGNNNLDKQERLMLFKDAFNLVKGNLAKLPLDATKAIPDPTVPSPESITKIQDEARTNYYKPKIGIDPNSRAPNAASTTNYNPKSYIKPMLTTSTVKKKENATHRNPNPIVAICSATPVKYFPYRSKKVWNKGKTNMFVSYKDFSEIKKSSSLFPIQLEKPSRMENVTSRKPFSTSQLFKPHKLANSTTIPIISGIRSTSTGDISHRREHAPITNNPKKTQPFSKFQKRKKYFPFNVKRVHCSYINNGGVFALAQFKSKSNTKNRRNIYQHPSNSNPIFNTQSTRIKNPLPNNKLSSKKRPPPPSPVKSSSKTTWGTQKPKYNNKQKGKKLMTHPRVFNEKGQSNEKSKQRPTNVAPNNKKLLQQPIRLLPEATCKIGPKQNLQQSLLKNNTSRKSDSYESNRAVNSICSASANIVEKPTTLSGSRQNAEGPKQKRVVYSNGIKRNKRHALQHANSSGIGAKAYDRCNELTAKVHP